jgi:hypothetical protein
MALLLALGSMVVIGVLVASSFFAASQRTRIGAASMLAARVLAAADYAAYRTFFDLSTEAADTLPVGAAMVSPPIQVPGGGEASVTITRLQGNLCMMNTRAWWESPSGGRILRRTRLHFRIKAVTADGSDTTVTNREPVLVHSGWVELH